MREVEKPKRPGCEGYYAADAAYIVPPTGAKGLNLAVSDVFYLSWVWKAQRFSWWMTALMHNFPDDVSFENQLRSAELEYVFSSQAALVPLSENYVGLPL